MNISILAVTLMDVETAPTVSPTVLVAVTVARLTSETTASAARQSSASTCQTTSNLSVVETGSVTPALLIMPVVPVTPHT